MGKFLGGFSNFPPDNWLGEIDAFPTSFPEHRVPKLGAIPLLMLGFSKKMLFLTNHQIVLVKAIGNATGSAIPLKRFHALGTDIYPA